MEGEIERDVSLRPIRDDDLDFLCRVYASTRMEELAGVPWTPEQKQVFLRFQFDAQHRYYQENYAGSTFDVVLVDGEPAGRLYVARWEKEIRIVDVAMLPEHRGRGIGSRLLAAVLAEGDEAGKPVSIHVEASNPARRLYERLGFRQVEDKGVYVLMRRTAGGGDGPE